MSDPGLAAGAQGEAVGRLQEALRQAGLRIPQGEAARRFFGAGTRAAVGRYQKDHALPVNGRADPATLASLAASSAREPVDAPGARATSAAGRAGLRSAAQGGDVEWLHRVLESAGFPIGTGERERSIFGPSTLSALQAFQAQHGLAPAEEVDAATLESLVAFAQNITVNVSDTESEAASTAGLASVVAGQTYVVTGSVQSPSLPGVPGVSVQLVDKNVGGDHVLASTTSAVGGAFSFSVVVSPAYLAEHTKSQPDLQVQALTGGDVLGSSEVQYSAAQAVTLNVVVPATAAGVLSEYETLTASLAAAYSGSLGALQEDSTRQDISYLANKTGWDARAVALAALADQFSQITVAAPSTASPPATPGAPVASAAGTTSDVSASVRPEFYYALFRAGLPANADTLFQASSATVQAVWKQAITQGVIPQALSDQVPAAARTFQALSAAKVLGAAPTVGVSPLAEMLQTTLPEASQQEQFADLYTRYADDPDSLWPAVETAFGAGPTAQLRSLGQLYYLTLNNQPLVAALVKAISATGAAAPSSQVEVANRGYYEASAWTALIAADSVPPQIPGGDTSERASNYAALLAAQVRLAYPTAVLADQVKRGIVPITDTSEVASDVVDFLTTHQGEFEIGAEPVEAFIARTGLAGTAAAVIAQVKRLQRVYQLTPDDTSLAVLLNNNLDSAYAITRYDPAGFVRAFSTQLGGEGKASVIHARARQVFVSVLGVATEYLKARMTPTLGGATPVMSGLTAETEAPPASVVAYPTLEGLFGSLDYCGCSDCGSILSPAAYFVDLLHFLDVPQPTLENPQDVLFARRPDLQYLNLTCANTNMSLPYIDLVNETLEYYVANGLSIEGYEGHNTSDEITSAELIASPQFVNDDAYAVLQGAFFPPPLPFDRPLTLLRLQLQAMGIELPVAMAALRAKDNLTNATTPTSYGWRDILIEQLGISREEYRLFTDPSLTLADLYGLPSELSAAQQLQKLQNTSLQDFSRRLGVSYDDLVAIVETQFINPNAAIIPLLEQLNCTFATLEQLNSDPAANSAAFILRLPAGLDATQYGGTTPDDTGAVVTWVTSNYSRIIDIITITNTSIDTSDPDDCSGANLFFQYTNPASSQLSATDFLTLIRFVRLWQKLAPLLAENSDAAAIADTDNILAALYPSADQPLSTNSDATNQSRLDTGFATMLLRLGFLVQVMNQLSLSANASLNQLLACWADIGTLGASSLYATMFLTPALLQQDPGAQTATVSSTVSAGDVLTTTINPGAGGAEVSYTVKSGQSAATVATAIAASINNSTAIDPATQAVGLPVRLNQRFLAASDGAVITIKAGFTLACETSTGATEYEPLVAAAGSLIATVGGTATAGDVLTTTIDGVPVPYTVTAGATPDSIAAGIAAAINSATAADPLSAGQALKEAFSAVSGGATVTVKQASGSGFTLGCSCSSSATEAYTSVSPICHAATINGPMTPGETLTTHVNTVAVPYTLLASDTADTVAAGIAVAINGTTVADPYSGLPLNDVVVATTSGPTVMLLAANVGAPFTLACALIPPAAGTAGASSYSVAGPTPVVWTATITGSAPQPGDVLTTTINTVAVPYTAGASDTDATALAKSIAATINTTAELDPATNKPLHTIVQASSAAGVVTIAAVDPGTVLTVACKASPGAEHYVAAGPLPETALATVSGAIPAGATLATTIDGLPVFYAVPMTSTPLTPPAIAQGVAAAINATTTAITGTTPLNQLVTAVASTDTTGDGLVAITAANATTSFTIEVALTTSGYTAGQQTPPFASDGSGEYLTDPTQTLLGYEPTLCAACNLTGTEFQKIVAYLDWTASTPLSLETVSSVFRYGWLAHTLGLSVAEFLRLVSSSGLDPFAPLDPGAPPTVEPPVLRFVGLFNALGTAGLGADQALYLMWNQDITGTSAPSPSDITGLALTLRAASATVAAAFTLQDDPNGSIAQRLMTLVYGATATDFFVGLLNNTLTTSVPYSAPPGVSSLPEAVISASSGRLSYNNLAKQLTYAGFLDTSTQRPIDGAISVDTTDAGTTPPGVATFTPASMHNIYPGSALVIDTGAAQETVVATATTTTTFTADTLNAHPGGVAPFPITSDPTLKAAIATLAAANLQAVAPFFTTYPELKPLYLAYVASTDPPQSKRTTLLANFLPILIRERNQEQALASVTSTAGTDQSFAAALLQDASVLHADTDPSAPAVTDFTAIQHPGLAAQFFLTNDLTAPRPDQQADCTPNLSYAQTATIGGTITPGEILTTTIQGVPVPYAVGAFSLVCAVATGATETLIPASPSAAASQSATVAGTITAGDTLTVTLDGVPVPYTVTAADTSTTIAANIAAAINATTAEDPLVGAPLNEVLVATSAGDVLTVGVAPGGPSTQPEQIASRIAAIINATATPVSGVALNQIVAASATGSTITLARANLASGGYFSLSCSVTGGASTRYTTGTQLPTATTAGGTIAAIWSGYITVPQNGAYDVNIAADPGASITLEIDGARMLTGLVSGSGLVTNQTQISLVAGQLVPIVLTASSISTTLAVSWQTQGTGWQEIPGQYLYSSTLVNQLSHTYIRFLKVASLAGALSLTAAEIAYLGTADSFAVNTTATSPTATTPGTTTFTPTSMANIQDGTQLVIDGPATIPDPSTGIVSPGPQETVTVTNTPTSTTFKAVTTKPHGGTGSPYPIVTVAQPKLGEGWINSLAGAATDIETTSATDLATVLMALLDFARIKRALSPNDSRVLAVLEDPAATLPDGQDALLTLTGWSQDSLAALLTQLFPQPGRANLTSVQNLARVYDAFALVTTSRLSASVLISAITNAPSPATVGTLQSALRSHYAPRDWLTAVTPINNAARIAQRDALVAYIVQQEGDLNRSFQQSFQAFLGSGAGGSSLWAIGLVGPPLTVGTTLQGTNIAPGTIITDVLYWAFMGFGGVTVFLSNPTLGVIFDDATITCFPPGPTITTPSDLYAYLMIDPENQPPVLTSRMLLATLTVQLFIERAIRNLESQVSPSDINDSQWTWMKRYRVWQANREVFLWPENWLYPELRDNQSPFFQTTVSNLLQGDIDDDAAASAYLDYLTNLEEVAKLEPCGMYYQPATTDTDETALVVSRTAGAHRKYYFRELSSGSWGPWGQAQIDCEDLPLTPIVWNGRLFLFWLKILKQPVPWTLDGSTAPPGPVSQFTATEFDTLQTQTQSSQSSVSIGAVLCWSEYYNGKWQPMKTSDVNLPTSLGSFPPTGSGSFEQSTRGLLRIIPTQATASNPYTQSLVNPFPIANDSLILAIVNASPADILGGFILHNTHSLPVCFDGIDLPAWVEFFGTWYWEYFPLADFLGLPSPSRTLSPIQPYTGAPGSGTFAITYESVLGEGAVAINPVLGYNWMPRFTESQPFVPGAWPPSAPTIPWEAPFLYEDRRQVFYVTTTFTPTWWSDFDGFATPLLNQLATSAKPTISPLVLRTPVTTRTRQEAGAVNVSPNNPGAIQRYLAQSTRINAALASTTTVTYQGNVISPTGSTPIPTQPPNQATAKERT